MKKHTTPLTNTLKSNKIKLTEILHRKVPYLISYCVNHPTKICSHDHHHNTNE